MRAVYIFLLAASLSLIACTSLDALERSAWIDQNRPKAEAGEMKWSYYYSKLRELTEQADEINSKEVVETINKIYKVALTYEAGKLEKSEFISMQRGADQHIAELELKAAPQSGASDAAWGRGTRVQETK